MGGSLLSNYYQRGGDGTKAEGREGRRKAEATVSMSSVAFNWNGTKKKIEVVQQTDFNPFSVLHFRHSFLFPLIGQRQ